MASDPTVVVPVRNGENTIGDCIESLLEGDYRRAARPEIVVVDNGSVDRTAEIVRGYPVTYVHEPRPGVSNARNAGIAASDSEIVAFIDSDCVASPRWLRAITAPFDDDRVGIVAGEIGALSPQTSAARWNAEMLGRPQSFAVSRRPPFAASANLAVRRSVFDRIGPFDPHFARAQDVDLGRRFAELDGLRIHYAPEALVLHRQPESGRAVFRQQLGWSYGAGLIRARYGSAGDRLTLTSPREMWLALYGLVLVAGGRLLRRYERVHLNAAWYELVKRSAWWIGAPAGLLRGKLTSRRERGGETPSP